MTLIPDFRCVLCGRKDKRTLCGAINCENCKETE